MTASCATGQCQISEKIWGVITPESNKLHRLTFSKSLAQDIVKDAKKLLDMSCEVRRFKFRPGRTLAKGEESKTGLYGIISTSKQYALRISLIKEVAELYTECDSRYLTEVHLKAA